MTDNSSSARPGGADRRPSGWLPVALIVLGVLVLAGNLGLGLGPVWRFVGGALQLWPVALVALGLDMLTRGSYRLLIWSVAVAVVIVVTAYGGLGRAAGPPVVIDQATQGAARSRVELDVGAGPVNLTAAPGGGDALWGTVRTAANERLSQSARKRGDTLEVSLRARAAGWPLGGGFGAFGGGEWDLNLNQDLPTDLVVDGGVGALTLDLERAQLGSLDLDGGVGAVTLTLPRAGGFTGSVDGGVGSVTIVVPRALPVIIEVDTGIGGVNVDPSFARSGNTYSSPAVGAAGGDAARLQVDVGVGSLTVRSLP